jgi:hypothetical protein
LIVDEELDLSELEQVLDDVDTEEEDETFEDPELELDLGDSEELAAPGDTVAIDNELDFDLSDFEDDLTPTADADDSEPADMELEFEVEEGDAAEASWQDEGLEETVAVEEAKPEKVDTPEPAPEPVAAAPAAPATKPVPPKPIKKKGVSKSLVFFLIVAILGGGGYGAYVYMDQNGIEIPFQPETEHL